MKQVIVGVCLALISLSVVGQCPDSLVFNSQAEIDNFAINFPDCTTIFADLLISGSDINDLTPLQVINSISVTNSLIIDDNPILESLDGLENIISLRTTDNSFILLEISNNPLLTSTSALSNMIADQEFIDGGGGAVVGIDLIIQNNPNLLSFDGLENIETTLFTLEINDNDSITDLTGFLGITTIDDLFVANNTSLSSLTGLDNLELASGIILINNDALLSLNFFNEVIACSLTITDNEILQNLDGLAENTGDFCGGGFLTITNNPNLSNCSIPFICNTIPGAEGIVIENNAIGCNSEEEVVANCPSCPDGPITLSTQAEVDAFAENFSDCTILDFSVLIQGDDIQNLEGLAQIERIDATLTIQDNPILESLEGLNNLVSTSQRLQIFNNPLLENLTGLDNYESPGIDIRDNNGLITLEGISSFAIPNVTLFNNNLLVSIEALNNATEINQNSIINISGNEILSQCAIDLVCEIIDSNGTGGITINNNGPDCEELDDVFANCTGCPLGFIQLSSQEDVNNFGINFPNCTEANISISGSDIVDLTPLQNLTSVTIVSVINNPMLTTLEGLNNITNANEIRILFNPLLEDVSALSNIDAVFGIDVIGNDSLESISGWSSLTNTLQLEITNNPSLSSINGLQNLSVNEGVRIDNNDSLESLEGLQQTTSLINLNIIDNDALTDISALSNLNTDLNSLVIQLNPQLTNLDALQGINNVIFSIDIDNNNSLQNLNGLSNITNESINNSALNIDITFNDALVDISGLEFLDASTLQSVEVTNNSSLSQCSILSFCEGLESDAIDFVFNTNVTGCNSQNEVFENCINEINTIQGSILYDFDANDCDVNDYSAENILVVAMNSDGQTVSSITDETGFFSIAVPQGNYELTVSEISLPDFYIAMPPLQEVVFDGGGELAEVDFCLTATETINDVNIVAIPLQLPRPGFEANYVISYSNLGTVVENGIIEMVFDDELVFFVDSSFPTSVINENSIQWEYADLLPFETRDFIVSFEVFQPPTVEGGELLVSELSITTTSEDDFPENNTFVLGEEVVNSFDPNDKQVLQGEGILEEEVGDFLDYIVRFQNTGTADAITVEITDELSDNLNTNTLRVLASSHDFTVNITDGNQVSFLFENINLPPEEVDEEGSNGYIVFQVRTNENLILGDSVENTANIFFDFNEPIITNTVVTTVAEPLALEEQNIENTIRMFPNPTSTVLNIDISLDVELQKIEIYSLLGEKVNTTVSDQIDVSALSTGVYFAKVFTDKGTLTRKIVKE